MADPLVAQKSPIAVDVQTGKTYYWCACGRSASQPFCDGSHKGTEFVPQAYKADADRKLFFCACKHSLKAPLCDGTHKSL